NNAMIKYDVESLLYFFENGKSHKEGQACFAYNERLMLILKSILYDAEDLFETDAIKNSSVADAVKYIRKNYAEEISVKELAQRAHLSANQFSRIFLKNTGFTPYQYIKEYRLNMALAMLEEGVNVAEVAQNCGFLSTSAFSNSFKKRFGKSPVRFVNL
ncbi:MAG: helix-turn-helix transcriptional regulator, partial [Oscillospiraceae bacterium]|nr:helix-turn-helix transcriptional regulator [Oscillospiraceae bacterium]